MTVTAWRLCARRHAASGMLGHGARRFDGRWNEKGTALVYASSSLALAALETLVHANVIPTSYVSIRIDIPPTVQIADRARAQGLGLGTAWPHGRVDRPLGDRPDGDQRPRQPAARAHSPSIRG